MPRHTAAASQPIILPVPSAWQGRKGEAHTSDFNLTRNTIARNNQHLDDRRYDDLQPGLHTRRFDRRRQGTRRHPRVHAQSRARCQAGPATPPVATNIGIEISGGRKPRWTATCSCTTRLAPSHGNSQRQAATPSGSPGNPTARSYSPSAVWTSSSNAERLVIRGQYGDRTVRRPLCGSRPVSAVTPRFQDRSMGRTRLLCLHADPGQIPAQMIRPLLHPAERGTQTGDCCSAPNGADAE